VLVGLLVEGLLSCRPVHSCVVLLFLWRFLSAGGIVVIYLEVYGIIVVSFGGLYLWQNCPTVHIDKDQTLEV
jgi:hypothetical protein